MVRSACRCLVSTSTTRPTAAMLTAQIKMQSVSSEHAVCYMYKNINTANVRASKHARVLPSLHRPEHIHRHLHFEWDLPSAAIGR